jgi:hypothetical protein
MLKALFSRARRAAIIVIALAVAASMLTAGYAAASGKGGGGSCKRSNTCSTADSTAPSISIGSPSGGSTVSGSVTVSGTATDNVAVASVAVSIDGGAYSGASGAAPWSFQLNTSAYTDGSHTISARATDTSGNVKVASESVTVGNAPTPSPSPTVSSLPSPTTSPSPSPTPTSSPAPGCQVDSYGVTICINSSGSWTFSQIDAMLVASARDLAVIGPTLTINVQDTYASMAQTSSSCCQSGRYYNFTATVYLQGNTGTTFAAYPEAITAHEYGHVWTLYHLYMSQNGAWASFLNERWSSADGSVVLATDSRLDSSYVWTKAEIIAEDYRLLFGSSLAISEMPTHMNTQIIDPRNQAGLGNWMLTYWAVKH